MSGEQRGTFLKFRDADDAGGNLGWSTRISKKAMRIAPEAPPDVEDWEMSDGEKVIWRLIKIPRRYIDLENAGVMPPEKIRGFLRGLVSADVVDILEASDAKPLVPIEIKRMKDKVAGKAAPKKDTRPSRLKARVYRPDISGEPGAAPKKPEPPIQQVELQSPEPKPAPAPVAQKQSTPAPSEAAAPRTQDVEELAVEIEARFSMMGEQNHYEFFEVQPSSPQEGIKKAYMRLAKVFHPDRISGSIKDPELIEQADKLFKRLQNAWSTLGNDDQRKRYDSKLAEGGGGGGDGTVRRPDEAKVMFLKAEHLAKAKQWGQALRHYKTALQLDDSVTGARVGIGWATYFDDSKDKATRIEEARQILSELANHHKEADAAYKLALISRLEGNVADHEKYVRLAARINPRHQEAQQEKRLIDRRQGTSKVKGGTAKKGGGLFSKLKR